MSGRAPAEATHDVVVRLAEPDDAPGIAEAMIASWIATYRGIMPDVILDDLDLEQRSARWRQRIEEAPTDERKRIWVVTEGGRVRGYAVTLPAVDEFAPPPSESAGEIDSLYLHPDAIGRGLGRALHDAIVVDLLERGFHPLVLWAFRDNEHARRFYEGLGWVHDLDGRWVLAEEPLPIVRYVQGA